MPNQPPPQRTSRQWWVLVGLLIASMAFSQGWTWWQDRQVAVELKAHVQQGDIVLYTTSSCPYCARAKSWLTAQDIPWRECPIETNARCEQDYLRQGSPGVPLMRVRDTWHLGFDPNWVKLIIQTTPAPVQAKPSLSSGPRP